MEQKDPLDLYMESLESKSNGQQEIVQGGVFQGEPMRISSRGLNSSNYMREVTIKNRRYRHLQLLLQDNDSEDWYFNDSNMEQRDPALFHFYLGQYISKSSSRQASGNENLSSFLMATCQRKEMEKRRQETQRQWGKFNGIDEDESMVAEDTSEEEEEEQQQQEETTKETEETIEVRREALIDVMSQRFLQGLDKDYVEYQAIDSNEALDDMSQITRDKEEIYFSTSDF
jgi:hypothetical protein